MNEDQEKNVSENQETPPIPPDKWFYFAHGRKAASIEELKTAFESMDDAEFRHHVNYDKNDFANWVEGVFGEKELAKNLREVADKEGSLILIEQYFEKKKSKHVRRPAAHHEKVEKTSEAVEKVILPKEKAELAEQELAVPEHKLVVPEHELAAPEHKPVVPEHKKISLHATEEKRILPPIPPPRPEHKKILPPIEEEETHPKKESILSESELKTIVEDAREALRDEEKRIMGWVKSRTELHHNFVVKEFIYGFVLGLIFGLIMLGVIINLTS
ncbi:MAG TPA: hypothetical protein VJ461_03885 [Candidatus Nanoarchaeia archaeon]|nr:hypothetical protein [Candidatus Nanoarchaeia archaeon]